MSFGTLGGIPFRVDPTSVSWTSTPKVAVHDTVGGRVVQVYGTVLSDLIIEGTFGKGGWQEQGQFLGTVQSWMDSQVGDLTNANGQALHNGPPLQFTYPPLGWNLSLYLLSFVQPGSTMSIDRTNDNFSPKWSLRFMIYQDNGTLKVATETSIIQYINNLSADFGYFPGTFAGNTQGTNYPSIAKTGA